ncbi:hypothetical protein Tco_0764808 [Tanacetum coccineum]
MNQTQGNLKEVRTPRYLSLVVLLRKVGDEAVHKELGDRMERAATTASSSEAEQDSGSGPRCQDTILGDVDAQTRFETTSKQSNDPPLLKVNTFGSGEDSLKILELMEIAHNCLYWFKLMLLGMLLVQVPTAEGDSINTSIKGFTYFFIRFHSFKHSLNISPNSISSLIIKIIIMSSPKFAETHNVVAFLEKPAESDGFAEIIDFLKASSVSYALTVNPIIYTSCIQQFWATAQVKTVNEVRQLQALIDKKKVIITEASIRNDLHLDDAEGTECLPNTTIFEELAKMGYEKPSQKLTFYKAFFSPQWKFMIHTITQSLSAKTTAWNEFSSTMASLIICLATNRKFNLSKYIFDAMVKHLDGGVKFLLYPRFLQVFLNQQLGDMTHHKKTFVNPYHTKKIFANMKREGKDFSGRVTPLFDNMLVQATEEVGEDSVPPTDSTQIPTIDQPSTSSQPKKKQKSRRKQRKEAETAHAETEEEEHLNTPSNDPLPSGEDIEIASLKKRVSMLEKRRQLRTTGLQRFKKLDAEVTLMNEQQNEDLMFDTRVLDDDEVFVDVAPSEKNEQSTKIDDSTAGEAVITVSVEDSAAPTIQVSTAYIGEVTAAKIDELTLAQILIEINAAKPKVVTTAATTTTTTRPKAKGVVVQEPIPLKRKDQIALEEQIARDIQAKLDAELEEEHKLARKQKEEEANIALIDSWENTQAMMEADRLLAERLQSKEREELTDKEKGKLFMELMEKRRKHSATLRAQEKRNRPPTKAQKRTQMSTYLKHMGGYTYKQLKGKNFDEIQKLFDKEMKRVNTFMAIGSEEQENKEKKTEGKQQQQESSKKQKIEEDKESDEVEEVSEDNEGELLKHLLIRVDGSSKRYSSMIRMLQGIDREDLEVLWRIVKAKHNDTRPEDEFERVLWGDLKVMFEPDTTSDVWRMLQGYRVTIWKLIDSSGVHFVRNLKIQKLNIKFRGGLLRLERLQGHLRFLLHSNGRSESRLNIISFTKTHKFLQKGCQVFLTHITERKTEKKSEEKRLEDVPIVRDFPKIIPEDFPGLPLTRQVE